MKIAVYAIALNEEQFVKRWYESAKDADYLLIASAQSSRQLYAIAEHIGIELKRQGIIPIVDGTPPTDWVVVDAGDIIVHLFRPEARDFYNLEKMWGSIMSDQAEAPSSAVH